MREGADQEDKREGEASDKGDLTDEWEAAARICLREIPSTQAQKCNGKKEIPYWI